MARGRPWVRLKIAASLDGRTALANGVSKWITGPDARCDAHRWRARSCAMLTGIETVIADDSSLDVRDVETTRQPLRVVVDSALRMSAEAKMLTTGKVLVATVSDNQARARALTAAGAEVLALPGQGGRVDLAALLRALAERGINEVTVEAGAVLNGALLEARLVDELVVYLAPMLFGDSARGMLALPELKGMGERTELSIRDVRSVGKDLRIVARL